MEKRHADFYCDQTACAFHVIIRRHRYFRRSSVKNAIRSNRRPRSRVYIAFPGRVNEKQGVGDKSIKIILFSSNADLHCVLAKTNKYEGEILCGIMTHRFWKRDKYFFFFFFVTFNYCPVLLKRDTIILSVQWFSRNAFRKALLDDVLITL